MRNAWAICLQVEYNLPKGGLILNVIVRRMVDFLKPGTRKGLRERSRSYQLVGEVMAHQGYDG